MFPGGLPLGEKVNRVYNLDDDNDLRIVGMSKNETRADKIVHYVACPHLVLEDKGKSQPLSKCIKQVAATVQKAKTPDIRWVVIIKQKIPRAEQGFYHWDHNSMRVSYASNPERPVIVANGLPLHMLTPGQARAYGLV